MKNKGNSIRLKRMMMGGRVIEANTDFIDTLSATCRLPVYEIEEKRLRNAGNSVKSNKDGNEEKRRRDIHV